MYSSYAYLSAATELEREFDELEGAHANLTPEYAPHLFQKGLSPVNVGKNRYQDIIAFDRTAVEIGHGEYLNANWVRDDAEEVRYAPQPFIMTQAPTLDTMVDFYTALVRCQVSVVVCLTPLIEGSRVKANRYWPSSKQDAMNVASVWKVQMLEEGTLCRGVIQRRVLRVSRVEPSAVGPQEVTFTMFHYQSWCDHASPVCVESFAELLRAVRGVADQDRSRPVLAHCSAGVGRAGTFVAAYNLILLNELDLPHRVSTKEMVDWLRYQRNGAVQSFCQYAFIPRIVALFEDQASSSDSLSTSGSEESCPLNEEAEDQWLRTCQIPSAGVYVS